MKQLQLRSCAKINLGLEIVRKRPDGYHDLNSIFIAIDLHDELTMERSEALSVECNPPVTDILEDNLVFRAAHMVLSNSMQAAKIRVTKHIPSGGGLGGGSSNAATTLLGLSILYPELGPLLAPYSKLLGSDVTFFLNPGVALVQGRGEIITSLEIELPWIVLLVFPGLHLSTQEMYSTLGITCEQPIANLISSLMQAVENPRAMPNDFTNDFEPIVFKRYPQLASIKSELYAQGAVYASMSGSGSTMYGLYTSVENAEAAQTYFASLPTYICRPVDASFLIP
ncbi:MAG: 4-(cytidine 5'-diphospho)-2-C-methyl-D-erythritol kinase [bacterium]|nr:4-(cytidine 5'-diphospho)-2-C-methyl-D-erythritol kinase [bacterium]